VQGKVVLTP